MKRSSVLLLLAAAVVGFIIGATLFVGLDRYFEPEIVVAPPDAETITVEVAGAVASPGVVTVPYSSRLRNVVDAAGGLAPEADVTVLNMAGRVADGERVVIPAGAPTPPVSNQPAAANDGRTPTGPAATRPASTAEPPTAGESQLIDLNAATAEQLETLPGIGPVLAGRIVAYRDANGPFSSVDELVEVQGIDSGIVDELRPFVSVGA